MAGPAVVARVIRLGLLAALLVAGGFVLFLAARPPLPASLPRADGAAVLTGGAGRIEAGFALLTENRVRLLLISGVHAETTLADLMRDSRADVPTQRVTLGRTARSTRGNAREIAAWAAEHRLARIVVVTHRLHMRRTMLELRRAAPALELVPLPVADPDGILLLRRALPEYAKLAGVMLGVSAALPERDLP
jgi:uncharacterized SAM-binding protein YcdF (DUF218 family)